MAMPVLVLGFGPWLLSALRWLTSKSADWWGAAGQWGGAIGSVAAVVAALWIARQGTRDAAERDYRRQRANAVLVYSELRQTPENRWELLVGNDGQYPVVDLRVIGLRGEVVVMPPLTGWPTRSALRPGDEWKEPMRQIIGLTPFARAGFSVDYGAVIEYTDVEGYRWRRAGHKLPMQVK